MINENKYFLYGKFGEGYEENSKKEMVAIIKGNHLLLNKKQEKVSITSTIKYFYLFETCSKTLTQNLPTFNDKIIILETV